MLHCVHQAGNEFQFHTHTTHSIILFSSAQFDARNSRKWYLFVNLVHLVHWSRIVTDEDRARLNANKKDKRKIEQQNSEQWSTFDETGKLNLIKFSISTLFVCDLASTQLDMFACTAHRIKAILSACVCMKSEEIKQLFGLKYGLFCVLRIKHVIVCMFACLLLNTLIVNGDPVKLHSPFFTFRALHLNADDTKHNELLYIYASHSFICWTLFYGMRLCEI